MELLNRKKKQIEKQTWCLTQKNSFQFINKPKFSYEKFNENVLPCVTTLGSDLGFVSFFDGRMSYTKIFHKDVNAVSTSHSAWYQLSKK